MGSYSRFRKCLLIGLAMTGFSVSPAQIVRGSMAASPASPAASGRFAGSWILTGQYFASGAPMPPTANLNVNDTRLTITGESSGTFTFDEPLRFGSNGKIEISCRGTITGNFTASKMAGLTVVHQSNTTETTGPACRQQAGIVTKLPALQAIIDVSGDTLRVINGLKDEDSPTKTADMAIYTYKRIHP